jgi:hypothetical protein
MLTLLGGRERTESELRGLIEGAGFKIARVASTGEAPSVIEARS